MNKQELAEQILKAKMAEYLSEEEIEDTLQRFEEWKTYDFAQAVLAAIVEAMGVQQESEHNPNLHNLDITYTGVCSKCGGTNLMDAPSAPAKAVEAMPEKVDIQIAAISEAQKRYSELKSHNCEKDFIDIQRLAIEDFVDGAKWAVEAMDAPAKEGMRWVKASERLPEVGQTVLTFPHYKVLPFGNAEDEKNHDITDTTFWEWDGSTENGCPVIAKPYPTHWMPLPEPPSAQPLQPSLEEKKEDLLTSDNNSSSTACDAPFKDNNSNHQ
jgi:hypothetical protein